MNSQCQPNMQIHIIARFTTHRADVEFSRVVAYTNVSAGGPPGRNVVETYIAMKYISTLHSIITIGSSYIFRNNYNTYL